MKCIICERFSLNLICNQCQKTFFCPTFHKREIQKDFFNYSFYNLDEIEDLILSKYHFHGDKIFNILAKLSFQKFSSHFVYDMPIVALPLDDHTRHNFSHTAILAKYLNSNNIFVKYNCLKAKKQIKYAGKDLEFRKNNPREFVLKNIQNQNIILIDDLITSGQTLLEAKKVCEQHHNKVLFSLTLADAQL